MHIAVLEDDPDQYAVLALWLQAAGHTCEHWERVADFQKGLVRGHFDAVLLDWMLPDGSGLDALTWIRQTLGWGLAVVVLTACDDEATVIEGLQAGADDYVVKPPKQHELLARVSTAVRRASPASMSVLKLGAYEVDLSRHTLCLRGEPQTMTQKEFDLATYCLQNPGKLLSRDHLLNKIWGLNTDVDTRTVDTHVSRLRKKLQLDGSHGWKMTSIYGFGYRLDRAESVGQA